MSQLGLGSIALAGVPDKLRSPGLPPLYLSMTAQGASVKGEIDVKAVLDAFVQAMAKQVRKRRDLQLLAPGQVPPPGSVSAKVRVVILDAGNRWMRYFLTLLGGHTLLEIEGAVTGASRREVPFNFRHKGSSGIFGGNSMNLLKMNAKALARKVAKLSKKNEQ